MKKKIALLLGTCMILALAGCGNQQDTTATTTVTAAEATEEMAAPTETAEKSESAETEKTTAGAGMEGTETSDGEEDDGTAFADAAVVYFSATGNTSAVADTLAQVLGAEVYEIVPETAYTEADLNYSDDSCRANQEMEDETARPGISSDLSAVEGYETVYIGYPIWWGTAPRIINTFLESYDFSGKTIYTFCTSGSSGVETSVRDLQSAYPDLNIVGGRRFNASVSADEIGSWLEELAVSGS